MGVVSGIFLLINSELLESCEKNDRRAQKKLYEIFFKMHMGVCYSYMGNEEDARIMLNTSFLKVCMHLKTINQNAAVFYSWSKKIVINCILDEFRRTKRIKEREIGKETERELEHQDSSNANYGLESLLEMDVKALIAALPDNMRKAFMLNAVEGYSHKEIAEIMDVAEGTSKWLVFEARKILRAQIENDNNQKMVI